MKYSTIVLAFAATISAQSIADIKASIPQCAQECLLAAQTSSGCSATDVVCQCGSGMAAIKASATECLTKGLNTGSGCSISDALMVQSISDKICAAVAAMPPAPAPTSAVTTDTSITAVPATTPANTIPTSPSVNVIPSNPSVNTVSANPPANAISANPSVNGTWSTVYSTRTYTITSCAPTVTNCPAEPRVTTEVIFVTSTFCPYSSPAASLSPTTVKSTATASPVVTSRVGPTTTPIMFSNSTMVTTAKGAPTTASIQVTGAASNLRVGGILGAAAALAALAL